MPIKKSSKDFWRKIDRVFQNVDEISKNYREIRDSFAHSPEKEKPGTRQKPSAFSGVAEPNRGKEKPFLDSDIRLSGVSFGECQQVIRRMNPQEKIHLERKAVNPHDKNAVAVIRSATGEQIGWIPRECNTELAAILDKGMDCRVELIAVSGKPGGLYGVSVRVFYMDEVVSKVKKNQDIFAQDRRTAQKKKAKV